jgi:glutaryl-CoA dehydrogenase
MLARNLRCVTRRYTQMTKMTSVRSFASGFEKFDFTDPLNLDGLLTDEEKMIQESARQFAQEKLLPRVTASY